MRAPWLTILLMGMVAACESTPEAAPLPTPAPPLPAPTRPTAAPSNARRATTCPIQASNHLLEIVVQQISTPETYRDDVIAVQLRPDGVACASFAEEGTPPSLESCELGCWGPVAGRVEAADPNPPLYLVTDTKALFRRESDALVFTSMRPTKGKPASIRRVPRAAVPSPTHRPTNL